MINNIGNFATYRFFHHLSPTLDCNHTKLGTGLRNEYDIPKLTKKYCGCRTLYVQPAPWLKGDPKSVCHIIASVLCTEYCTFVAKNPAGAFDAKQSIVISLVALGAAII